MNDQKSGSRRVKILMSASHAKDPEPSHLHPQLEAESFSGEEDKPGLGNTKAKVRGVRQNGKKTIQVTFGVEGLERQLSE